MKLVTLACNHCGGKLKITRDTKFVTCTYCDTQLAVHIEDGAAYTEVREAVEELAATTEELREEVGELRAQNQRMDAEAELARIDREWEVECEPLMMRSKGGRRTPPTRGSAYALFVVGPVMAALMVFMFSSFGAKKSASSGDSTFSTAFVLIAVLSAGGAIIGGFYQLSQATKYAAARRGYEDRRAEAESRLAALARGPAEVQETPRPRNQKKRRAPYEA